MMSVNGNESTSASCPRSPDITPLLRAGLIEALPTASAAQIDEVLAEATRRGLAMRAAAARPTWTAADCCTHGCSGDGGHHCAQHCSFDPSYWRFGNTLGASQ